MQTRRKLYLSKFRRDLGLRNRKILLSWLEEPDPPRQLARACLHGTEYSLLKVLIWSHKQILLWRLRERHGVWGLVQKSHNLRDHCELFLWCVWLWNTHSLFPRWYVGQLAVWKKYHVLNIHLEELNHLIRWSHWVFRRPKKNAFLSTLKKRIFHDWCRWRTRMGSVLLLRLQIGQELWRFWAKSLLTLGCTSRCRRYLQLSVLCWARDLYALPGNTLFHWNHQQALHDWKDGRFTRKRAGITQWRRRSLTW